MRLTTKPEPAQIGGIKGTAFWSVELSMADYVAWLNLFAIKATCPKCHAKPGVTCGTPTGKPHPTLHQARRRIPKDDE